ncbi:restriction endonuclease subunit S, partial [Actinobacillus pleuropneumoniae]|nr:restriction endonuclease subunit S [Actinobacillus pleuropneumoniae]
RKSTGSTFKAISKDIIDNTIIPIPPLNEQIRIVEKIETLFSTLQNLSQK